MKVITYSEKMTEEDKEFSFDVYKTSNADAQFVFCDKTIYEYISKDGYRYVHHELTISHFKLDPDKCLNLCLDRTYKRAGHVFGVKGLALSSVYTRFCPKQDLIDSLTKQDLDDLQKYTESLMTEVDENESMYWSVR